MVDDRITDGDRIAELLIAEIRGWTTGPLESLSVQTGDTTHQICVIKDTDEWDPRREPPNAAIADRIGSVTVHADHVRLAIQDDRFQSAAAASELSVTDGAVVVDSGAKVKPAMDILAAMYDE